MIAKWPAAEESSLRLDSARPKPLEQQQQAMLGAAQRTPRIHEEHPTQSTNS
jgi:hypothetical protein